MAAANAELLRLSDQDRQVLESWLVEFDRSWQDGRLAARVRELPPPGTPWRGPALIEMVKIDLERQWQQGRRAQLEDYLRQYPELGRPEAVPPDLIQAEFEVRQQFGATPDLADFERRFPRQAEKLRQLLNAGGESPDRPRPPDTPPPRPSTHSATGPASGPRELPEQFGRYRILKKLGQGGMGAVYLAHDTQLDRKVALKVPHFKADDSPDLLGRFHREARAAATVQHPNICPVHDVGEIDGVRYLTMAYIEGKPLSEFVHGKPLPQRQVAALVRKLALALQEAHRCGVIHRDLKPANIMINERKEPVIMDFGLARRLDKGDVRLTQTGSVLGTPAYMPPEQVSGQAEQMGPGCDVYSLGVILYELLTGRLPFEGPMMAILGQILTQEPPPPSFYRPDLDPRLDAVCRKAMAKRVQDRCPSMADLAADLAGYLRREAASSPPAGAGQSQAENLSRQLLSDSASRQDPVPPPSAVSEAEHPRRPRVPRWAWLSLAGGAAAAALLGIVIIIIKSNGTDAKVHIKEDGTTVVITTPSEASRPAPVPEPSKERPPPVVLDAAVASATEQVLAAEAWQLPELLRGRPGPGPGAAALLTAELDKKVPPEASPDEQDRLAKRKANAATALVQLGQAEKVWPLLERGKDARLRAYLLERLGSMPDRPQPVNAHFEEETAWGLEFDRGRRSHLLTPFNYRGRHPITVEAMVTSFMHHAGGPIVSNTQQAGLGLFHASDNRNFIVWLGAGYKFAPSKEPTPLGRPVHVAGVFDTNQRQVRLYVDGKLVASTDAKPGERFKPCRYPFMVGADPDDFGAPEKFFDGRIQEVRISRAVRYVGDFVPAKRLSADKDTLLLYHLDEGEGTVAYDVSGNSRHGTIKGATWVKIQKQP